MDSENARPTVDTEPPPGVLRRAIAASAIGNATEWFDYGIYAYGVTYISAAIFPGDTASATLLALMTFAVSFLVRPLGGLVWGPLGDRLGRKQVLAVTILAPPCASAWSRVMQRSASGRRCCWCSCGWSRAFPLAGSTAAPRHSWPNMRHAAGAVSSAAFSSSARCPGSRSAAC